MTREETAEVIKVMQAWVDGEEVQYRSKNNAGGCWGSATTPCWDLDVFVYRIKPKPTLIPWSNPEDVPMNCCVCHKDSDDVGRLMVVAVHNDGVEVLCDKESSRFRWQRLFDEFLFTVDGKVWKQCGKVE